ncbi:hypothetical protein FBEOM_7072 [Fusarium beomiforme]|uniref:Uncharacterized protein n=1 Tax=Fusarium beomiforme TaxID=44412 RepID=A0A9P5AHZ4_9HYPO|nr:hypothetical protein FBEOM_7072 [Fusarium beomiforme]
MKKNGDVEDIQRWQSASCCGPCNAEDAEPPEANAAGKNTLRQSGRISDGQTYIVLHSARQDPKLPTPLYPLLRN